jgi:DNA helicase HerA-like ATPase
LEQKTGRPITLSADLSRVILICGKRGSGKSYTLGVIAEELVGDVKLAQAQLAQARAALSKVQVERVDGNEATVLIRILTEAGRREE